MPDFDIKLCGALKDLPGQFLTYDMTAAAARVTKAAGIVSLVENTAGRSQRAKARGDTRIATPWNARGSGSPGYSDAAFGTGALNLTASGQALRISHTEAPSNIGSSYSFFSVTNHTFGNPGCLFTDTSSGTRLQYSIDDPANSHKVTYRNGSGTVVTSVTGTPGQHVDCLTLDANAVVRFFRDSDVPAFTGTNYISTPYGGIFDSFIGDNGIGGQWFFGTIGKFVLFDRALTIAESILLIDTESQIFGNPLLTGRYQHVSPILNTFDDPVADDGRPSRLNSVAGHAERYYAFKRGPYTQVDAVVLPIRGGTAGTQVDPSANFVPHFVEWPFQATQGPPQIFSSAGDPSGVVRIRLRDTGLYTFRLYKVGGGAVDAHFTLEP